MARHLLFPILAAVAAAVAAPTTANAATTASLSGGTAVVRGGPEVNDVTIGVTLPTISDPGGVLAGAGCTQDSATQVTCGGHGWSVLDAALGDGDDALTAGALSPRSAIVLGEGGNDTLGVGSMDDHVSGGDGNDTLYGGGGGDRLEGGAGDDNLQAGGGSDTIDGGPGQDSVTADGTWASEDGNDVLALRDGERDSAACGLGADRVTADLIDVIDKFDCEAVDLPAEPAPGPSPSPSPSTPGPTPSPAPAGDIMLVFLDAPARSKLSTLIRTGLRVTCEFEAAGSFVARLTVSGTQSRKLGRRGRVTIAQVSGVIKAGAYRIRLRPTARYRTALRRVRRIAMRVEVRAKTTAGTDSDSDSAAVTFIR